jgi:hypothetical protein
VYAAAGLLLATCAVLLYGLAPNRTQVMGTVFLYVVLVSPLLYFPRSTGAFAFAVAAVGRGNERYFLLANFGLCCLAVLVAAALLARARPEPAAGVAVAGLLALALLQLGSFRLPPWGSDESIEWHRTSWLVQQWQRATPPAMASPLRVAEPAPPVQTPLDTAGLPYRLYLPYFSLVRSGGAAVSLPIIPDGWCMFLAAPGDRPPVYQFPEGPVLLGVGAEPHAGGDRVQLAWQGSTLADPVAGIYYTAYAHRVDDQGTRLAGVDVLLAPAETARCGSPLFSAHEWPRPAQASTGDDLVVGLYHFRGDQVVEGNSILLEDFFARP